MIRTASRSTRVALVSALFSALLVACGDSDTTSDPVNDADSTGSSSLSTETPTGESGSENVDPLGFRVSAAPETELTVEIVPVASGVEQQTLRQKVKVTEEPWSMLFTVFIDSATLTISLESGSEANFETIRGHLVDVDDPFGPIEVTEVLDTVPVSGQEPIVVTLP